MAGTKRARACQSIWEDDELQQPTTRRRTESLSSPKSQRRPRREIRLPRRYEQPQQENQPSPQEERGYNEDSDEEGPIVFAAQKPAKVQSLSRGLKRDTSSRPSVLEPTPPATPHKSRRIDVIRANIPSTPKHRVTVTGLSSTPRTPRTPRTPSSSVTAVYGLARKVFSRAANAGPLVGRETERDELRNFVTGKISTRVGGCIYVSGPPGSGKSVAVQEVLSTVLQQHQSITHMSINCMSMKSSSELFTALLPHIETRKTLSDAQLENLVQRSFGKTKTTPALLILDEIDHLLHLDLNAVYKLFEWSMSPGSSLILIGIANALDLTDRFLPRLKARNMKPVLLPFLPYSAADIASVLTSRARSLLPQGVDMASSFTPFLHPTAIQLISKKVAAQTGDLRKAFDIAQCSIDLVENETREKIKAQAQEQISPSRTPLAENPNLSSPMSITPSPSKAHLGERESKPRPSTLTSETAPRATVAHVVKITAATFGNGTSQRLKALNLQQKAVMCALVMLEQKNKEQELASEPSPVRNLGKDIGLMPKRPEGRRTAPALRDLYEVYSGFCKTNNLLHRLSSTEFRDVVENLETLGLISGVDGRCGSFASMYKASTPSKKGRSAALQGGRAEERKVSANVQAQELHSVAEGPGSDILLTILRGEM